ncbi:MAG: hypothetical protein IKO41_11370 [Lachnospiraceae bacterium]|nr:hypothetical protein [Lachnospiraceae bacterium]
MSVIFSMEAYEQLSLHITHIQKHIVYLQQRIEAIQARLTSTVTTELPHDLHLPQSIPGVSLKGAVIILIELGSEDISPFKTAKRLASGIG